MRVEAIAIGTELLTTHRMDTNSIWISQRLAGMGLAFHRKTVVGDRKEDLLATFQEALTRSDLIITSGGLGPTFDDMTKEFWAELLRAPLIENPQIRKDIEGFFLARKRPLPPQNLKQALVPAGAEVLRNPLGTAPGLFWKDPPGHPGVRVVMLPGVPRELKHLWECEVEPRLAPLLESPIHTLRLLVGTVGESALDQRTTPIRERYGHLDWTILASLGQVELLARHADPSALEPAQRDLEAELGEDLICTGPDSLEQVVLQRFRVRHESLAVAESVTGGRISALLTAVPGASQTYLGGASVYSPTAKIKLADLSEARLAAQGTVSASTSVDLAEGIRTKLGATWGLGVTGNAGPTEDPAGPAPVGTCHVAVVGPKGTRTETFHLTGERPDIQARCTTLALDFLRRCLL